MKIRAETPDDGPAVRRVNERAFGQPAEADLVERLHERNAVLLSLVAEDETQVMGHLLFTLAEIVCGHSAVAALGPMAVLPEHQRRGVGSRLVQRGLDLLRGEGHPGVVVLGHPSYYPKFGFRPAREFGLGCEFDVPDEVFMALELREGALAGYSGTLRYRPEFNEG